MTIMGIYYSDLNEDAQKEFDEKFGAPEEHNHEISPLFIYGQEDEV